MHGSFFVLSWPIWSQGTGPIEVLLMFSPTGPSAQLELLGKEVEDYITQPYLNLTALNPRRPGIHNLLGNGNPAITLAQMKKRARLPGAESRARGRTLLKRSIY